MESEKHVVDLRAAVTEVDLFKKTISDYGSSITSFPAADHSTAGESESKELSHDERQEFEKMKHVLRERTTQLKILMETMDSLQLVGGQNSEESMLSDAIKSLDLTSFPKMSSTGSSWATKALIKRVVELAAELTSQHSATAIEERKSAAFELESRRRGSEINRLKHLLKREEDSAVSYKLHIASLTSQLRDSEKTRLESVSTIQRENERLLDHLREV